MPLPDIAGYPAQRVASFLKSVNQVMQEHIELAWDDLLMAHGLPDGLVDSDEWHEAGLTVVSGFGYRVTMKGTALIVDAANEPRSTLDFTDDQKGVRLYLQSMGVRFDRDQAVRA